MATSYLIFHPKYPGHIWVTLTESGDTDNTILSNIIKSMKRGVHTESGYNLRCVPDWRDQHGNLTAKAKDATTLGKQFAPKKPRGSQVGLRKLSEENRYKGKVEWESNRERISAWIAEGISRGKIAGRLGVSPSTLSEANKRHGLYEPRSPVA